MDAFLSFCDMAELPAAILLICSGIFFSAKCGFFQITRLPRILNNTLLCKKSKKKGSISPFQAFSYSLAGTLGIGNIVGVAQAINTGGAGAVFWIWISAVVASVLKCAEIFLSLKHKGTGPCGYIRMAYGSDTAVYIYCGLAVTVSLMMGNMAQSGAVRTVFEFSEPSAIKITAAVLAGVTAVLVMLKPHTSAKAISVITPVMTVGYILLCIVCIALNIGRLPGAFADVFRGAFDLSSIKGGLAGSAFICALRSGCMNGLFSHESGMGSSAFAHANTAEEPLKESVWGVVEVYTDSIIVSGLTAFLILTSNNTTVAGALTDNFGIYGRAFSIAATVLFAVSSMITWEYYGRQCFKRKRSKYMYTAVFITLCYVGAVINGNVVWRMSSLFNSALLTVNIIALTKLGKEYYNETKKL